MTSPKFTNSAALHGRPSPEGNVSAAGATEIIKALLAERVRVKAIIATASRLSLHADTVQEAILSGVNAEKFTKTFEVEALARNIVNAASQ